MALADVLGRRGEDPVSQTLVHGSHFFQEAEGVFAQALEVPNQTPVAGAVMSRKVAV